MTAKKVNQEIQRSPNCEVFKMETDKYITKPIVYYDGQCGFCTSFVRFLIQTSKAEQRLSFIPYQVVTASVPGELMVVWSNTFSEAGKAAIKVLNDTGGIFKIPAFILKLFPGKLLDKLYYSFARNRYRWFGQSSCVIN